MSIATENAKQIRAPMDVIIRLNTGTQGTSAYANTTGILVKTEPANRTSTTPDELSAWQWRNVADFQGDGFPLDGSYSLWDNDLNDSAQKGIVGYRSIVGWPMRGNIIADFSGGTVPAVTIRFTQESSGTIAVNGVEYDIQTIVTVPITQSTTYFEATPGDNHRRIEIASFTPGVNLTLRNDDLISCTVVLRADLSPESPSFPVSELEVTAYMPADISQALANIDVETPVRYTAGYTLDYSKTRNFYLSEPIETENNTMTIKAEDASSKLDSQQVPVQLLTAVRTMGARRVYTFFRDSIRNCGISLLSVEAVPPLVTAPDIETNVVFLERSVREHIQNIMNLGHRGSFWPVFVDAGTPTVRWSRPTASWDIYEEDCGEVKRNVAPSIAAITGADDTYIAAEGTKSKNAVMLYADPDLNLGQGNVSTPGILGGNLSVTKNVNVIENFEEYYWKYDVLGQSTTRIWTRPSSICFRPSKTTTSDGSYSVLVAGYPVIIGDWSTSSNQVVFTAKKTMIATPVTPGRIITVEPIVQGTIHNGAVVYSDVNFRNSAIFPRYESIFERSPITGSFLWKGDPRMQPRDVFNFHRLDGTVETCTIESIELKHEGGGTTATISYRLGVV